METAKGKTREEIISRLAERIDSYKRYTRPHSRVMAELAAHLARRFGLTEPDVHAVAEAALLVDIGLYAMTPPYLASPGPLTFEERIDLWRHPIIGEQQMAKREASRQAQLLVRWHHEWWNGSGYPDMLAFEDIPIGARILRAVELYSALISDRTYRAALTDDEAKETLLSSAGIECDPYVVQALVALLDDLREQAKKDEPAEPLSFTPEQPEQAAPEAKVEPAAEFRTELETEPGPDPDAGPAPPAEGSSETAANEEEGFRPQYAKTLTGMEIPAFQQEQPTAKQGETPSGDQPAEVAYEEVGTEVPPAREQSPVVEEAPAAEAAPNGEQAPVTEESAEESIEESAASPRIVSAGPRPEKLPPVELLLARRGAKELAGDESDRWKGWTRSRYNKKALLGFEASVLRQIEFRSIAIAFSGWAKLDWYLKGWGKLILSNDPRPWAAAATRAMLESKSWLDEQQITRLLEDVYVPGVNLSNPGLRRWFGEIDAWWLDNLRRSIERIEDETLRAQALVLGLQTGDYAMSFNEETRELKRPLTTIFWRLAGRVLSGPPGHPHNRGYNVPVEEFVSRTRADLLYLNLPSAHAERAGSGTRSDWRDCWVRGADEPCADDLAKLSSVPQSKQSYLAMIDRLLRSAAHLPTWAIEYQEVGLASARDISELIKEHRPVRATYSKDLTEVTGGLHNYIIIADRAKK